MTVHPVVPAPVKELLPHDKALTVGVNTDDAPLSLIEVVFDTDPCVAVNVTVCEDATAETIAEKLRFVAPEGTVTEAGTVTALLLLPIFTVTPAPEAAAFSATVQTSLPAPTIEEFAQVTPDNDPPD